MERLKFRVVGTLPILMSNPESMNLDTKTKIKSATTSDAEVKAKAYRMPSGQLYIPSAALRRSLVDGGVGRKLGRMTAKNAIKASVFPIGAVCPLEHPKTGKAIKDYEVSTMRAVNPNTKNAVSVSRPLIDEWACVIECEVDTDLVSPLHVLEIWNLAGRIIGVLSFRVECGGQFGRYKVEPLFDVTEYGGKAEEPKPKKGRKKAAA